MGRQPTLLLASLLCLVLVACSAFDAGTGSPPPAAAPTSAAPPAPITTLPPVTTTTTATSSTTTTTAVPLLDLRGTVTGPDGAAVTGATVSSGGVTALTGTKGRFRLEGIPVGRVTVERPGWTSRQIDWAGRRRNLEIALEPRVVRGVRAIPEVAGDPGQFGQLLQLIRGTNVNALVFDTKDETGMVRYDTSVERARQLGAVNVTYDPAEVLARTHDAGLYAITRIVTFEDQIWSDDPAAQLAGLWVNPVDRANWPYPIGLAVEACKLGFDEVQFDYVRFPAGQTADAAQDAQPLTADQRVEAIRAFLARAKERLHPLGCAVSAAIFGIVASSPTDEGIGQRPEELSTSVDALSPMVYPSHYSPGWLGFDDPNDHPSEVTADALDDTAARVVPGTIVRPWLQAFYWSPQQIAAAIAEAEARGLGWILWNAAGNYPRSALPKT